MMNWRKLFLVLFIVFAGTGYLPAQDPPSFPLPVLVKTDTSQSVSSLALQISNQEFVYDAEFFNPLDPGYTLLGGQLQSVLRYRVTRSFSLSAGTYLLKYSGMDGFVQWRPVLSATYRLAPVVEITMGTLKGSLYHRLPEPLYKFDLSFSDYMEEGIQARVNTPVVKGDYWIDWRSFIQPGDMHQEELVFGTSTSISLLKKSSPWSVNIPFYSLVFHRGGQIDATPFPVRTFGNVATGFRVERTTTRTIIDRYRIGFTAFHYFDVSGDPLFPFTSGTAVFPEISIGSGNWTLSGGYWWTDHFYSLTGSPQYATVSASGMTYGYPDRQMVKLQLGYYTTPKGGPELFFFCNGYWDVRRSQLDYSISLQLIFNRMFHLLSL